MKAVRKVVFWIHLALGCVAGLVILTMSVTGILLAFERQITTKFEAPAALASQTNTVGQAPVDALLEKLKNNGQGTPTQLVLHSTANAPVEVRYGREKTLFLNPWTAEVIGQPNETVRGFFETVERIHRSVGLGMRSKLGRGLTGAANLAFLFMLISGLYLWLPKVWTVASVKARVLFRRAARGRAREWNWHHVIGVWVAVPLIFIVASGVVMSYPWANNLLYTMTGSQPPVGGGARGDQGSAPERRAHSESNIALRSLEEMLHTAKQQVPQWESITVDVPREYASTLTVSVDTSIGGQPEKARQLVLNRETGRVDAVKRFSDNVAGRRLRAYARFVHTGEEFGLIGQMAAALASLGAVMLVWTGLSMALQRLLTMASGAAKSSQAVATKEEELITAGESL